MPLRAAHDSRLIARMASLSVSRSLLAVPGIVLLAAGVLLYVGSIATAVIHVGRQYSSDMSGVRGLRTGAAFAAAGKRWYFLAVAVLGGAVLAVAR